jgi:hypothetical protein
VIVPRALRGNDLINGEAMDQKKHGVLEFFASKLAPTSTAKPQMPETVVGNLQTPRHPLPKLLQTPA